MYKTLVITLIMIGIVNAWGGGDRVKLEDVKVLTLYQGQMTTSRRSYPVPQIKCVGGTAKCEFVPQTVQCKNVGSDGFNVQWECKADLDNAYRFGRIEVVCEGYDYPDDPYILRGSCGLEYTLDFTKGGENQGRNDGYGSYSGYNWKNNPSSSKNSFLGNIILFAMIALIIYGIYRTCISNYQYSSSDDGSDPYQGPRWSSNTFGGASPPPPGFRSDYMPDGASCSGNQYRSNSGYTGSSGAGGFWTGAATGGILGYLLGNRSGYGSSSYYQPRYHSSPSSDFSWGGGSSSGGFNQSSGTRTASGYGGTRRR